MVVTAIWKVIRSKSPEWIGIRCDLPPKRNVHCEDRKLERVFAAFRRGFCPYYFSVARVLRPFFDTLGFLTKHKEKKRHIYWEYIHFENLSEVFVRQIFPMRAVLDNLESVSTAEIKWRSNIWENIGQRECGSVVWFSSLTMRGNNEMSKTDNKTTPLLYKDRKE